MVANPIKWVISLRIEKESLQQYQRANRARGLITINSFEFISA
jgi:hypothetical protein